MVATASWRNLHVSPMVPAPAGFEGSTPTGQEGEEGLQLAVSPMRLSPRMSPRLQPRISPRAGGLVSPRRLMGGAASDGVPLWHTGAIASAVAAASAITAGGRGLMPTAPPRLSLSLNMSASNSSASLASAGESGPQSTRGSSVSGSLQMVIDAFSMLDSLRQKMDMLLRRREQSGLMSMSVAAMRAIADADNAVRRATVEKGALLEHFGVQEVQALAALLRDRDRDAGGDAPRLAAFTSEVQLAAEVVSQASVHTRRAMTCSTSGPEPTAVPISVPASPSAASTSSFSSGTFSPSIVAAGQEMALALASLSSVAVRLRVVQDSARRVPAHAMLSPTSPAQASSVRLQDAMCAACGDLATAEALQSVLVGMGGVMAPGAARFLEPLTTAVRSATLRTTEAESYLQMVQAAQCRREDSSRGTSTPDGYSYSYSSSRAGSRCFDGSPASASFSPSAGRFGNNSSYNNNNSRRTSRFGEGPSGGGRDRYAGSMMGSPRVNVATLSRPDQETSLRDASAPSQPGMLQPRPPVMSSAGGYGAPRYAGSMAAAGQATMRMGGRAALLEEDREMDDVESMVGRTPAPVRVVDYSYAPSPQHYGGGGGGYYGGSLAGPGPALTPGASSYSPNRHGSVSHSPHRASMSSSSYASAMTPELATASHSLGARPSVSYSPAHRVSVASDTAMAMLMKGPGYGGGVGAAAASLNASRRVSAATTSAQMILMQTASSGTPLRPAPPLTVSPHSTYSGYLPGPSSPRSQQAAAAAAAQTASYLGSMRAPPAVVVTAGSYSPRGSFGGGSASPSPVSYARSPSVSIYGNSSASGSRSPSVSFIGLPTRPHA